MKKRINRSSLVGFSSAAFLVVVSIVIGLYRQPILDQLSIWSYEPSAAIDAIAQRAQLTPSGKFTFYATKPVVASKESFNKDCPRQEVGNPILGCYTSEDRIYVYDITNEKLNGIEEVTAVHEMLHAVWQRHSPAEVKRLNGLLTDAYARIDDESLRRRMDYYQRTEPNDFVNELHSIIGTEVSSLDPELEAYYEQYFNRSAVLGLHNQYSAVYTALYDRSDELNTLMTELSASIETDSAAYDAQLRVLEADISSFNARADAGSFSSTTQFYSERSALVRRSNALDAQRSVINVSIDTYNAYYQEYTSIAGQIEVLDKSLDSFSSLNEAPAL